MPGRTQFESPLQTLAVVGVGLIGGSIARCAKERGLARKILGIGRSQRRLEQAVASGVIDRAATTANSAADAELVVICTPVSQIAADASRILSCGGTGLVTDVGSVKGPIASQLQAQPHQGRFVGSHPLAGSEKSGFEHADANLFEGRVCVVTPTEATPPEASQFVASFWEALGMSVHCMSPQEHDRVLARTSHLPHLAAAALALQLEPDAVPFAATGFHDTTRVASGDPSLWSAILIANRAELSGAIVELTHLLDRFRDALDRDDSAQVQQFLAAAQQSRERFLESFRGNGSGE